MKIELELAESLDGKYLFIRELNFYPRLRGKRIIRKTAKGDLYFRWRGHNYDYKKDIKRS